MVVDQEELADVRGRLAQRIHFIAVEGAVVAHLDDQGIDVAAVALQALGQVDEFVAWRPTLAFIEKRGPKRAASFSFAPIITESPKATIRGGLLPRRVQRVTVSRGTQRVTARHRLDRHLGEFGG